MKNSFPIFMLAAAMALHSCSPASHVGQAAASPIGKFAGKELLQDSGLQSAQIGISIYDPAKAVYLYNYQADKYFIPASNTKLFTLYAGLKYLGDSLTGIRYRETDTAIYLVASGDPTLLHPAFPRQPVIDLLKKNGKSIHLTDGGWQERPLGRGWAWDDYNDDYMSERSSLPVYGNMIHWVQDSSSASFYSIPDVNWEVRFTPDTMKKAFFVQRDLNNNVFVITEGREKFKEQDVPFITKGLSSAAILLKDTVGKPVYTGLLPSLPGSPAGAGPAAFRNAGLQVLHSRPVDSLFRPMMFHSDNFFAEQTLLMVSNERLGVMNDVKIIDTLLKSDLKELPQKPVWVDGCGLSRNDLFTPQDFIWLLDKMKKDFGLDRLQRILPTGGTGTLANYYKQDSGYIFAKTGSLSGVVALSGYLITKKGHLLLFSVLVNNQTTGATAVRRKVEKLIQMVREQY